MISETKGSEGAPPSYTGQGSSMPTQPYPQPPPPQPTAQAKSLADVGADYQAQMYAQCAVGNHQATTEFGLCGILTAIFCFPIGLLCLCADTHRKCRRCGIRM